MTAGPWKALLIDYGGTLDGDGTHWSRRFDAAFRTQGFEYSDEHLARAFRASEDAMAVDPAVRLMGLESSLRRQAGLMLASLGLPAEPGTEAATRFLVAETRDFLARNAAVLRLLKERYRLGILSNFNGNLERTLRDEGLRPLVHGVFDSDVVGLRKPDPAFFRYALDALETEPQAAAMIGDSVDMDLRPARDLGMATVWVREPTRPAPGFCPDFTLRNFRDLSTLLGVQEPETAR